MPRFLNPTSEALNDLNAPKRKVFKNMVKTFVDEKFPNLGTTEEIEKQYDELVSTLTDLFTSLADVANLIIYTDARATITNRIRTKNITDYFSVIIKNITTAELLVNRLRTFNLFTPEMIDNISSLVNSITQKYSELKTSPSLSNPNTIQSSLFANQLAEMSKLDLVIQKIQGLLAGYRQVPAGASKDLAIRAIPIPSATQYGVKGAGFESRPIGGAILSDIGRITPYSDGYTINSANYSQPARFY